ncbi:MAG: hypothetical protein MI976_11420 [Pseudomonadales bacterium]|nr:hypothetical protein [Pseudomonadales bacterium]
MNQGNDSLDLLGLFVNNFDVNVIYELGWYAASQWTAVVSGVLIALSIAIRSFEEKVSLASGGQTNYLKFGTTTLLIAVAMGLYFSFAWMIINFFQSIYGLINTSDSIKTMAMQLDSIMSSLLNKEYEFSWSDIYDSVYAAFATIAYAVTFCVLILSILAMRIAHAGLVSFCLFWGSVALPMSITTGLKQLSAFKTMCIIALIWPIIDAFLMYLIAGSFSVMIEESGMGMDNIETWSLGTLVFYLGAFSIINMILVATTISAPFIAQGLANGTGNVTGMIASFGAAGISAGVLAGRSIADKTNTVGSRTRNTISKAASSAKSTLSPNSRTHPQLSSGNWSIGSKATQSATQSMSAETNPKATQSFSISEKPSKATPGNSGEKSSHTTATTHPKMSGNTQQTLRKSDLSEQQQMQNNQDNDLSNQALKTPEQVTDEIRRKKQARRGAIINRQRKLNT